MVSSIDFSLSGRFSVVEQTIFRLVIGGVSDVKTVAYLLCLYSDDVIANAIKKLVNYQIVKVDFQAHTLSISEPILAIMDRCLDQSQTLAFPAVLEQLFNEGIAIITEEETKRQILNILLPNVRIGFLAKSLDFILYERSEYNE